jgi:hypothetical protein
LPHCAAASPQRRILLIKPDTTTHESTDLCAWFRVIVSRGRGSSALAIHFDSPPDGNDDKPARKKPIDTSPAPAIRMKGMLSLIRK